MCDRIKKAGRKKPEVPFAGITVSSFLWKTIILLSLKDNAAWKDLTHSLPCILHKVDHLKPSK